MIKLLCSLDALHQSVRAQLDLIFNFRGRVTSQSVSTKQHKSRKPHIALKGNICSIHAQAHLNIKLTRNIHIQLWNTAYTIMYLSYFTGPTATWDTVIKVQPGRLYRESNERGGSHFWSHILVQEWDLSICYLPSNCEDMRSKTGDMSHAMILSLS